VFESDSSKGQQEEEEGDKMSDAGSHASQRPTGAAASGRDAKRQARVNAKFQEKYGRSQAMKAVEDFVEACFPLAEKPTSKLELLETATTVLRHSVGFCEDVCVSESADVSVDFQEICEGRVRATKSDSLPK